jgi:cellulose synthase (UDP-forming)
VRVVGLLGVISTVLITYGYYRFVKINWLILVVLSIPYVVIVAYWFINYLLQLFYPGFDLEKHKTLVKNYWGDSHKSSTPQVTVFIPAAGEPESVVKKTIIAAKKIDYPQNKITVYLLDDTKTGEYKKLAEAQRIEYLNRPEHSYRKSGNLNYALSKIPETDHILLLDADFVPRKEILKELVPYTRYDVGIIQSPQHFKIMADKRRGSPIEFAAAYIQKEFYRIGQVGRSRFDSSICVGTNALYSYRALKDVDGFALVNYAEDVRTGIKIINHIKDDGDPYRIKYIPIQLATGTTPSDYFSFFKQQSRWAMGSFKFIFSKLTLFSHVLKPTQKILYFSNSLYYLCIIATLSMPFQFLALSLLKANSIHWRFAWFFLPQLLMIWLIMPVVYRRRKYLSVLTVTVANSYTFLQSLTMVFIRHLPEWSATGCNQKVVNKRYKAHRITVVTYYVIVYLGTLAVAIINQSFGKSHSYLIQILFLLALLAQTVHLVYLFAKDSTLSKTASRIVIGGVGVILVAVLAITVPMSGRYQFVGSVHPVSFRLVSHPSKTKRTDKIHKNCPKKCQQKPE